MYQSMDVGRPRRLRRDPIAFVENEVIITTVSQARNDDLPHFVSVLRNTVAAVTNFGDNSVDGVFHRVGGSVQSISRVFVPAPVVQTAAREGLSLSGSPIAANYRDDEETLGLSRTYKVTFQNPVDVLRVCDELQRSTAVQEARPNYISQVLERPNDAFYGFQWGPLAIGCEDAWEIETGHPDVLVAIVDSGADLQHDDLEAKLSPGADLVDFQGRGGFRYQLLGDYRTRDEDPSDEDGHGTHVAGIAAAASDNSRGVAGICWGGRILPVRVMFRVYDRFTRRETSVGTDADIDAGIKFAVDAGAHVINLSLGGSAPSHEMVLQYAYDQNVAVLAATGNDNSNSASYPASNPNVLAVGAVDENLNRASFSNYGPAYNEFVVAPGVEIASTYIDNDYVYLQGTSMATPFVTGLAALVASVGLRSGTRLNADAIYTILRETATPLGSGTGDPFYGAGLINAPAALKAAQQRVSCS